MDAHRGDIEKARHEAQLGSVRTDARFEESQTSFEAAFKKGLRKQARVFFPACAVLLAGILGLYCRI